MENVDRSMSAADRRKRYQSGGSSGDTGNRNSNNNQSSKLNGKGGKGGKGGGGKGGGGKLEQGVITSIKDVYGFIKCVVSDDIYFSMSQAPAGIAVGDHVEFNVTERQGKWSAVRLNLLPKGTVKFEDVLPGKHKGIVAMEIKMASSFGRRDAASRDGAIKFVAETITGEEGNVEGTNNTELLAFTPSDVSKKGVSLSRGDEVEFEVCVELKTGKRRATNICVVRTALELELANCPKEEGLICSIKDGFGFIQATTREQHVYFRSSDVDPSVRLEAGQEVSFRCKNDTGNNRKGGDDKLRAFEVCYLEPGTVQFEEVLGTTLSGYVSRVAVDEERGDRGRHGRGGGGGGKRAGCILISQDDSLKKKEAMYNAEDVNNKLTLRVGDEVAVDLYRHKASGALFVRNVSILQLNPQHREQGVVVSVKNKEGFGFIKGCEREDDLYFRISEYIDSDMSPLEANIEVEFDVSPKPGSMGKLTAERIQFLMEGTVWFEAALSDTRLKGEVLREPKGNRYGLVKCLDDQEVPEVETQLQFMDIWRKCEEFSEQTQTPLQSKEMTVTLLGARQLEAYVTVLTSLGLGYKTNGRDSITMFKFSSEEDKEKFIAPKLRSGLLEPDNHFVFHQKQALDKDYAPQKGDVVEFKLVMDRRSLRKCAFEVVLLERPAPTMEYDTGDGTVRSLVFTSPRKMRTDPNHSGSGEGGGRVILPVKQYREASKPDNTLGFAEGWRLKLKNKRLGIPDSCERPEYEAPVAAQEVVATNTITSILSRPEIGNSDVNVNETTSES